MKRLVVLLVIVLLAAGCRAPSPILSPLPLTPPVEGIPTLAPEAPATGVPEPPLLTGGPIILAEIPLGFAYDPQTYPRPLAVDSAGRRLYVSGLPDQTLALSTDVLSAFSQAGDLTAAISDTFDFGGNLALDPVNERLFVGTPAGLSAYRLASRDLLTQIKFGRPAMTIPEAEWDGIPERSGTGALASSLPAVPVVAAPDGDVYVIQNGVHHVWPGLAADRFIEARDVRAIAPDERRGLLYASINNGVPGSNNRNDLWAFDLRTKQVEGIVTGVRDFVVDSARGGLVVALDSRSAAPYRSGTVQLWVTKLLTRTRSLSNIGGLLALDEEHDRLYVLDTGQRPRLAALQASTLALIADLALPGPCATMVLDAQFDRLYLLSDDGHLLVVAGHGGEPPRGLPAQAETPPAAPVTRLVVSPSNTRDKTVLGIWESDGVLLASRNGGAAWSRVGDGLPQLAGVNDVAFSPAYLEDKTVFAATQRGLYRSVDGGETWQPANVGLDDMWVLQVVLSSSFARAPTLYVRTFTGGLHRSVDGGQTWVSLVSRYASLLGQQTPDALAVALSPDFEHDHTLFLGAGRAQGQLLTSNDAGDSWTHVVDAGVTSLYPSPGFAGDRVILGVFDQSGLMRSTDGGGTWSGALRGIQGASGEDSLALSPLFEQDRTALLLTRNPIHLYRTTDGGDTWQISQAPLASQITTLAISDQTVWFGLAKGQVSAVHIEDLAWAPLRLNELPARLDAIVLSPDFEQDGTLFVAGKDAGVWKSTDGGKTWSDTGFPAREVGIGRMHLAISPGFGRDRTVFAATGSLLYCSTDGGQSWQILPIGPGDLFPINALAVSPGYLNDQTVMLTGDYRQPVALLSADGGRSWELSDAGLPASNLSLLTFSPNYAVDRGVYVWAESDGLYRSGDGGRTWARVYQPAGSWLVQSFAFSPDFERDRLMFLGTLKENHNVYRSADGGASWHPAELGLPLELMWASALALSPDFGHDRLVFLGTDQGVYRSSDGGQMWRQVSSLPEVVALALSPGMDGRHSLFAVSARDGLYLSADGGEYWQALGK